MGIKSTVHISREAAIERINTIDSLIESKKYRTLDDLTGEHDYNLKTYVDTTIPLGLSYQELSEWADEMLEDKMDEPFYRYSMFENYIIDEVAEW